MKTDKILKLGNPELYEVSVDVSKEELPLVEQKFWELNDIILEYRSLHGAGRAIAAPQIGYMKRLICMRISDQPYAVINPVFVDKSDEKIILWDDCMSFPGLLVKVRRHKSCKIRFKDLDWNDQEWTLEDDLSELIQHEYDHLDGILAVQRAIDDKSFALVSQKDKINTH
ncbi:MAG: peptide deformylase [Bacteroidota bacterium]